MIVICKNRAAAGETYQDSWLADLASENNLL